MGLMPIKVPWTHQPPAGTRLRTDGLARGLILCLAVNEGGGVPKNLAPTKYTMQNHTSAPTWGVGEKGHHLDMSAAQAVRTVEDFSPPNDVTVALLMQSDAAGAVQERFFGYNDDWEGGLNFGAVADEIDWQIYGNLLSDAYGFDAIKSNWNLISGSVENTGTTAVAKYFNNGQNVAGITDTSLNPPAGGDSPMYIGTSRALTDGLDGRIAFFAMWDRILSDGEQAQLGENPWQVFEPQTRRIPVGLAAADPDLAYIDLKFPWTRQPPAGTQLDRSHPLAQGLVFFAPLNEGGGDAVDLVTGARGFDNSDGTSTLVREANQHGRHVVMEAGTQATDNNGFQFPSEDKWNLTGKGITVLTHLQHGDEVSSSGARLLSKRNLGFTAGFEITARATDNIDWRLNTSDACLLTPGTTLDGKDAYLAGIYNGIEMNCWWRPGLDGVILKATPTALTSNLTADATTPMSIGQHVDNARAFDGIMYWSAVWNRALTQNEIESFWANPWQVIAPQTRRIPVGLAAAAVVVITVVDTDNAWNDGDAGLVATGTGFV